jgi:hypothetical protein
MNIVMTACRSLNHAGDNFMLNCVVKRIMIKLQLVGGFIQLEIDWVRLSITIIFNGTLHNETSRTTIESYSDSPLISNSEFFLVQV